MNVSAFFACLIFTLAIVTSVVAYSTTPRHYSRKIPSHALGVVMQTDPDSVYILSANTT